MKLIGQIPYEKHDKEDEEPQKIDNILDGDEKLHNGDIGGENMVDVGVDLHVEDGESLRRTN